MSFDSQPPQDPFAAPSASNMGSQPTAGPKNSGVGIASFAIAIFSAVAGFALVVVAGVLEVSSPDGMDENSPEAVAVGLGLFAIFGLNLLGIGLGIAGVVQANRSKTLAVLGLVFNAFVILGFCGLMAFGLAVAG